MLLSHELFHILSRYNPKLREQLFKAIGFVKCREITLPGVLNKRKITNPDAPVYDHCIRVEVRQAERWAVPVTFSRTDKYEPERGADFMDYMIFRLLLVEKTGEASEGEPMPVRPIREDGKAKLVSPGDVSGFLEQVGRNTRYVLAPEEIIAENFRLLVTGERDVPTPDILRRVEEILKKAGAEAETSAQRPAVPVENHSLREPSIRFGGAAHPHTAAPAGSR
ncbi:MAG: hypothetical protein V5A84_02835 [Planctomycetota bacterium]